MKKIIAVICIFFLHTSCGGNDSFVMPPSVGNINHVLVVIKGNLWKGSVGDEIKKSLSKLQRELPQEEPVLSLLHVEPNKFSNIIQRNRNILIIEERADEMFKTIKNKYAGPQTIVYISAKNKEEIKRVISEKGKEIVAIFRTADILQTQRVFRAKKINDILYKTVKNLNISLTIPEEYRTVDDTGEFLWLRHRLKSGIAKGAGSNNIIVYALPLTDTSVMRASIAQIRDSIGERYIPGAREGMYMITEKAYTPETLAIELKGYKAFETRGKWEVKNAFMAGPFVNYTILDKKNNRWLIVEGFTYAPSVDKRDLLFELEAIAKSVIIK